MPRRKNQGGNVNGIGADSSQNVARNRSSELQSRDTTLRELQSMFSGSVDPEVVQLVLSESNYNVNDAIEKLFVLSGSEQDLKEDKHSSERKNDHEIRALSNITGTHGKTHAPTTASSSSLLPLSSVHCEKSQAQTHSEVFHDAASPTILSSGLPDFPDSISQQYKALKSQAKVPVKFETLPHEKPSGCGINTTPPLNQQVVCGRETAGINTGDDDSKPKETMESFLKQIISQGITPYECKNRSHDKAEQQRLDCKPSKKKMYSGDSLTHTDTLQDERQKPYKERISNTSIPSTNTQSVVSSKNYSLNADKTMSSYDANKPRFQPTVNSTQHLPNDDTFNTLPVTSESMFRPPAVQRQVQPLFPPLRFGQVSQGNTSQSRFGVMPMTSSPWQQGLQRALLREQVPLQYPQGNHPYQPPFFLGRGGQLSAAVRLPIRQASAVHIPSIPTIHQKLLILIRGLPGSGKSTLAQKLKGAHGVVLSTDDFFYRNQKYEFDVMLLSEAHEWNQQRAKSAFEKLTSAVIIDNTNTQAWEMKPYVSMALKYGYYVKFMEPDTSWKWNVKELARRNRHGVGIEAITRMKDRFEQGLTVEKIMNSERKPDTSMTENNSNTIKEAGAKKQDLSPRAPLTLRKEGPLDLGKSNRDNFDIPTFGENTALTETDHSLKSVGNKNNLEEEQNEFFGKIETSENCIGKSENSENSKEAERTCTSEMNISASENSPGGGSKEVPNASSSPMPQRVSRVRKRRSPNVEQLNDTDNFAKSDICACENLDDGRREESQAINSPQPQRAPRVRERRSSNVEQLNDTDNIAKSDICACENLDDGSREETRALNSPQSHRAPRVRERSPNVEQHSSINNIAKSDICAREIPDDDSREETRGNNSPQPLGAPRVRERRSPSDRDGVFDVGLRVKAPEDISPRRSHNELQLNGISNAGSVSEQGSAGPGLSKDSLSAADSCIFSPPFFKEGNEEGSQEVAQAPENSKSSMPSPSGSSSELYSAFMVSASSLNSDKSNRVTDELPREELAVKASSEEQITCNLAFPERNKSLSQLRYADSDATDGGHTGLKQPEPTENNSVAVSPPLSTILASASRSKQKKRSTSIINQKKSVEENFCVKSDVKQLSGSTACGIERTCSDHITQDYRNQSTQDVLSDLQKLAHEAEHAASGDSANDIPTGVEFLKTCFPDVESDVISALLTATSGGVMKVVDELLADKSYLASFPVSDSDVVQQQSEDSQILASQHSALKSLNGSLKSVIDESLATGDHAYGVSSKGPAVREVDRTNQPRPQELSPFAQAQSSGFSFQLTLEPAIALHLVELFGPFVGVNFQEDLSQENLTIDVDSALAKQLYKRWEKSIQKRKGISVEKRGNSPRSNKKPADSSSRLFNGIQSSPDSHRPPQQLRTGSQAGYLREIMDEQLALELSRTANVADVNGQDIATNLKRQKLYEMFPGVDPTALEEVFQANRFELDPSVEVVKASCNLSSQGIPGTLIAPGFRNNEEAKRKEPEEDWSWLYSDDSSRSEADEGPFQTLEAPSYQDYRAEAFQYDKQRDECFKKAALAFSKKQGELAQFYAQQGHMHTEKMKEANARAAALILEQKNKYSDENTIDLHGLHVTEAVEALENMLNERTEKGCKAIFVITGRGNNSRGGKARIKPAILEHLKKNDYNYTEPQPGLVKVFL